MFRNVDAFKKRLVKTALVRCRTLDDTAVNSDSIFVPVFANGLTFQTIFLYIVAKINKMDELLAKVTEIWTEHVLRAILIK